MREYMSWLFNTGTRPYTEVVQYADKYKRVTIFEFFVNSDGTIPNVLSSRAATAIQTVGNKIEWYIGVICNDSHELAAAVMDNVNGAQDTLMSEIERLIDTYPWAVGVDWDFEQGGGIEYKDKALALYQRIFNLVHAKGLKLHVDLPGMTGPHTTVGNEKWCNYSTIHPYFDTAAIMSYGMAWSGSAPGAISPKSWLDKIYAYAAESMPPDKIYMGMPGYGFRWQIDHKPTPDVNYGYRGKSQTYLGAVAWTDGTYNHTNDQPPQDLIPWVSYWDEVEKSPYAYLYVYDIQNQLDSVATYDFVAKSTYNGRPYSTVYNLPQHNDWTDGVSVSGSAFTSKPSNAALIVGDGYVASKVPQVGEVEGTCTYTFSVPATDTYDIVAIVSYPWWNKDHIEFNIDGTGFGCTQPYQWYPYARQKHYVKVGTMYLTEGQHTAVFDGASSVYETLFYGFVVCKNFSTYGSGGTISYNMKCGHFINTAGQVVNPQDLKITLECLRRTPEGCLIWSDDFRSYPEDNMDIAKVYYTFTGGTWIAEGTVGSPATLKQTLTTSSTMKLKYDGFSDLKVRAVLMNTGKESGITMGNVKVGISSNTLTMYRDNVIFSAVSVDGTGHNELIVRVKAGVCNVWFNKALLVTCPSGCVSNDFGLYTDAAAMECTTLECFDSYYYSPREAVTISTPNGIEELGRVERSGTGVTYDSTYNVYYIPAGMEEADTRTETISMDWDYLHSAEFINNGEFTLNIRHNDLGCWVGNIYLVDKNGSSIMYYSDVNMYQYWWDRCEFEWGLRGIAIWSLGMHDPNFYKIIPDQN